MPFPDALVLPHYSPGLSRLISHTLLVNSRSRVLWSKSIGHDTSRMKGSRFLRNTTYISSLSSCEIPSTTSLSQYYIEFRTLL